MKPEDATSPDDTFTELLAKYAEALAKGTPCTSIDESAVPEELRPRLQRAIAGLKLLQRLQPGSTLSASSKVSREYRAPSSVLPWSQLGRFQIRKELGRGGCGIVFLALDPVLGREVALKVPHAEFAIRPELRERFQREARAAAGLDHPNIVPVHESGEVGPVCFLVSSYCPGVTLAAWLKQRSEPVGFRESASFLATLAKAVDHAHGRGVVHRDLKPSNVLLQIDSPQSAICNLQSAIPKITDFGLAKLLEQDSAQPQTRTGAIVGTISYMAPEQAAGKTSAIGPAADIYALGAVLYELLTGRPPFQGESDLDALVHLQEVDPVPPARLRSKVPRDLETICLKCLSKEPAGRYVNALELAADLQRFLDDLPILARRATQFEQFWRRCRRNPVPSVLVAVILTLLITTAIGSLLASGRFQRERDRAVDAEEAAKKELSWSLLAEARAWRRSKLSGGRFDGVEAVKKAQALRLESRSKGEFPSELQLRNELIGCLSRADLRLGPTFEGFPPTWSHAAFDANLDYYASGDPAGRIHVRRIGQAEEVACFEGCPGGTWVLSFNADSRYLAVIQSDRKVRVFDLRALEEIPLKIRQANADALDFHPNGREIAVGHVDGSITLFDIVERRAVKTLWPRGKANVVFLAYQPGGRYLAASSGQKLVQIWNLTSGQVEQELDHQESGIYQVAWSGDGKIVAVACGTRICVWDSTTGKKKNVLVGHSSEGIQIALTHEGDRLASWCWDQTLRLWDVVSGAELFRTAAAGGQLRFSKDDRHLAFGFEGNRIGLWRMAAGQECRTLPIQTSSDRPGMRACSVGLMGRLLAVGANDGVHFWDLARGQELDWLPIGRTWCLSFTNDGQELLTSGDFGLCSWPIKVDSPGSGRVRFGAHKKLVSEAIAAFSASADGRVIAAIRDYRTAIILKRTPALAQPSTLNHEHLAYIATSPNGKWIATGTEHGRGIRVWYADTGREVREALYPEDQLNTTLFSPDSRSLVTARLGEFCIWDTSVWKSRHRFAQVRTESPGCVTFSPDGHIVAMETAEGKLQLFDPDSGAELTALENPTDDLLSSLTFTPDGNKLVTVAKNTRTIHTWDLGLVRRQLAEAGLDWFPADRSPETPQAPEEPLELDLKLGPEMLTNRAMQLDARNQRDRVVADYQAALAQDPDYAPACNNLAWLFATGPWEARNHAEALRLAKKLAENNDPNYLNTVGVVYYRNGEWPAAVKYLEKSLKAHNGVSKAWDHYFLAMCFHQLGQASKSKEHFENALRIHQNGPLTPDQAEELAQFRNEASSLLHARAGTAESSKPIAR